MCWRSSLTKLCKLTLENIFFRLPALQQVATRLHSLEVFDSGLEGSTCGFLTAGWTALTLLRLDRSWVKDDVLAALNLPVLEHLSIVGFQHKGGVLQADQLCCPQLRSLELQLDRSREGGRRCCSLLSLPRLTSLHLKFDDHSHRGTLDLGVPASLTSLSVAETLRYNVADLEWVLLEAAKCIRGGAQLRSLTYCSFSHPFIPWRILRHGAPA